MAALLLLVYRWCCRMPPHETNMATDARTARCNYRTFGATGLVDNGIRGHGGIVAEMVTLLPLRARRLTHDGLCRKGSAIVFVAISIPSERDAPRQDRQHAVSEGTARHKRIG